MLIKILKWTMVAIVVLVLLAFIGAFFSIWFGGGGHV
jgi:membrane protein implicated in regulation of membrane protease activity